MNRCEQLSVKIEQRVSAEGVATLNRVYWLRAKQSSFVA